MDLEAAYRQMLMIRRFEERLNELFLQGIVAGTTHLCVGQEACSVGVSMALEEPDCVFSNHRGHGHLIARGAEPRKVMAEIFGSPKGYAGGRGGSQHMAVKEINFMGTHGITAGTIPLAVGAALHKKRMKEPGAAVVYFGDGAIGEGVFHESLNMAQIWQLPVLFVCENNKYAMSTAHDHISPVEDVVDRAHAYNMLHKKIDGNDVEEVYRQTLDARQAINEGNGPWLLELKTFRVSGHSRGDKCEYRSRDEEADWSQRDPLDNCYARLQEEAGWTDADLEKLEAEIAAEIKDAEDYARSPADA